MTRRRSIPVLLALGLALAVAAPATAQGSRSRLRNLGPKPLGPAAGNPKRTVAGILDRDPAFAKLVKSQNVKWKNEMSEAMRRVHKDLKRRPLRIKKPKVTAPKIPKVKMPSLPRLPTFSLPSWSLPAWSFPSLPSIPGWVWTTLKALGMIAVVVLTLYLGAMLLLFLLSWLGGLSIATTWLTRLLALIPQKLIWLFGGRPKRAVAVTGSKKKTKAQAAESAERIELAARTPRSWKDLARELMAAGKGREAYRALYLAMLSRLDLKGLIRYERTKTNWQYRMQLPAGDIRRAFSELSRLFDRTWYGEYACDQSSFDRGDHLVEVVLSETGS